MTEMHALRWGVAGVAISAVIGTALGAEAVANQDPRLPASAEPACTTAGWLKFSNNPVLGGQYGTCFDVSVLKDDGRYRMWLSWRPKASVALAESSDGIHFERRAEPVFYPSADSQQDREWPGGCEDPRIVESEDGTYVMTYTQWNRKRTAAAIATSKDLVHWTKYGPALEGNKYAALSYKSAGIVTRLVNGRLIAVKIHDKYWMYWGEGTIRLATSDDLIHWKPIEGPDGSALAVLDKRPGKFDSSFPEVGPPPILSRDGIVVIYNGKNDPEHGDPTLGPNAYSAGQGLFNIDDPQRAIARADKPFFRPEMPFEKSGQYAAGTTFAEGLVYFKNKWFLYYGCADSLVGVAVDDN